MLKKFLGITLTMLLCLPSSVAFANSNVNSSSEKFTTFTKTLSNSPDQNSDYQELLSDTNVVTQNKSDDLLTSEQIVDSSIQKGEPIKTDVNRALLSSLQKSNEEKTNFIKSNSIQSIANIETSTTSSSVETTTSPAVTAKPIAELKYAILNPASLKNGQITTNTQIAWLWSYNGQNYTYDPNGYQITNVNIDGTPGVSDSVIGTLTGNIGFATQFKTPGQYIMKFKCMNDHNVWSDEWSISIPVEPTDNNTRPQCVINYSTLSGDTDNRFIFSWLNSKDNDSNDSIKDIQGIAIKDGKTYSFSDYIIAQSKNGCSLIFKDSGNYTLMFRVSDTHGAWSDWVTVPVTVTDAPKHTIQQVSINSNDGSGGGHNGIFNVAFVNTLLKNFAYGKEDQIRCGARITRYGSLPQFESGGVFYGDGGDWLVNLEENKCYNNDLPDPNYTRTLIQDWMTVNGKITNEDGTPASNATVKITYNNNYILNSSYRTLTAYAITDSNGNYTYKFNSIPQSDGRQYETHGIGSSLIWAYTYFLSPGTVTVSCGKNAVTNRVMQFDITTMNKYVLGTSEYVSGSYSDPGSCVDHYIWSPVE
ncbi:carboxypeptidase-like regulatory domain-containing protein [Clostridium saccharoperbutylacetonicum]|uniref:carboxypeptidase-like regulatory domain-containing protein n=1 Tax=Clostridium saccharoperbutylacetonicum TaxID=36745 RepID=UPI000983A6CA|nr:carboxypeptidase-like regulatory domain-containing protein [Clostridium saccharoperbutylacetonicum]AQR96904.1 hypothetical protein CLSAP_42280 [Clostridium saccharoperbutylacetonicum]NSB32782.1 hypothetical protein [Clostridium saccharoperbutylacetonicum]